MKISRFSEYLAILTTIYYYPIFTITRSSELGARNKTFHFFSPQLDRSQQEVLIILTWDLFFFLREFRDRSNYCSTTDNQLQRLQQSYCFPFSDLSNHCSSCSSCCRFNFRFNYNLWCNLFSRFELSINPSLLSLSTFTWVGTRHSPSIGFERCFAKDLNVR